MIDTPNAERWMARRNCYGVDPEVFFAHEPLGLKRAGHVKQSEAKAICAGCDVRTECLTFALENGEQYGVFGGLDEDERAELMRNGAA